MALATPKLISPPAHLWIHRNRSDHFLSPALEDREHLIAIGFFDATDL
jgi:hypothetical protein